MKTKVQAPHQSMATSRGRSPGRIISYALFVSFSVTAILAFAWMFNASMKTNKEFIATGPWDLAKGFSFTNYVEAFTTANMGLFTINSLVIAGGATALGVLIGALAAYPIARIPFRGSRLILVIFLSGMMIPWVVTFIPLFTTFQNLNLLDTRTGLVLLYATLNLPFNIFVLVGFMRTLPSSLEDAAAVDGAGPMRTFFKIVLPLTGPGLASVAIISFLANWNEFFFALLFLSSKDKLTLPLGLFRLGVAAEYGSNWVVLFAGLLIASVPILIVFALLQRQITDGLTAGAFKG